MKLKRTIFSNFKSSAKICSFKLVDTDQLGNLSKFKFVFVYVFVVIFAGN